MKIRILAGTLALLALAGCASTGPMGANAREMKIAFDFTEGNPAALLKKLENVDTTRQQLIAQGITPNFVLTFRGNASYFTQASVAAVKEADRADALKVAAKLRVLKRAQGVEGMDQCNLPLADRKLKPADVMPEVRLVPNGWIALGAYQQQGYAYIAP